MTTIQKLGTAELLFRRAVQMGLRPVWLAPRKLFSIETARGLRYVYEAKSGSNSHLSSVLARDKAATRRVLQQQGLPSIPFLQTSEYSAAEDFIAAHQKVIVKPLTGSNSRDVRIVESADDLAGLNLAEYILEKYIAGEEMRYLILDGQVIAVHRSDYGVSVAEDRYLERISYPESEWDPGLVGLSLQIAGVFGLRYAAVDFIIGSNGKPLILEVNSSPGMKWFHAPTAGPPVDVARLFLEAMFVEERVKIPVPAVM